MYGKNFLVTLVSGAHVVLTTRSVFSLPQERSLHEAASEFTSQVDNISRSISNSTEVPTTFINDQPESETVPYNFAMGENTDDVVYYSEEEGSNGDKTATYDITPVVPYDLERGENTDEEEPSLTNTAPSTSQKRNVSSIIGLTLVCSIVGYMVHRRRQRTRRREYRTHRILQEHVEAFDLNFRDEDDVELSSYP